MSRRLERLLDRALSLKTGLKQVSEKFKMYRYEIMKFKFKEIRQEILNGTGLNYLRQILKTFNNTF